MKGSSQQLVAFRGGGPGVLGELGLTALQAWQRLGDGLMAAFWDAPSATAAAFLARERIDAIEVGGYRPPDLSAYAVYEATNG